MDSRPFRRTSQQGEQLQGLEEADITKFTFTPVPVKSEEDEEKPQSSQLHQTDSSEPETDDSGDWKETREPQSDAQQLLVVKEEFPSEQQERSSTLDQEDPEPPHIKEEQESDTTHLPKIHRGNHDAEEEFIEGGSLSQDTVVQTVLQPEPLHIKEEQEEPRTSQEGEQLQGLEEADIIKFTFTPIPVKSEEDEEKPQSSQLHQTQTEQMETEDDGEDCGGPEPDRNSYPEPHLQPDTGDEPADQKDGGPVRDSRFSAGEKRFSCSECGKRFGYKCYLKRHMRLHTGEKPFSCSVCKKTFTRSGHLKSHMRLHTGEKLFSCSVCKKTFTRSGHLNAHMRLHTGEKPFGCSVCAKSFAQSEYLKKHMRVHT
ncbi:zinc finger protein 213-like [Centropristis striata]|uniref:zinc finger protein 213-like n=1 Tax=Centropristis striata TaxID=184440 RepID=UPI0027DEEAF3|nr:zinc finger protein 213-like [Centropristis striata]